MLKLSHWVTKSSLTNSPTLSVRNRFAGLYTLIQWVKISLIILFGHLDGTLVQDERRVACSMRCSTWVTYGKGLLINMQKLVFGAYLHDFTLQKNKNWQNYTPFGV